MMVGHRHMMCEDDQIAELVRPLSSLTMPPLTAPPYANAIDGSVGKDRPSVERENNVGI